MDLNTIFEIGRERKTYRRIDESHKVNIFLGYNNDGNMSLVITENTFPRSFKSSELIEVLLKKREDGKFALSFALLDEKYQSMFLVFCEDIIQSCEKVGKEKAIENALDRWKYWKEMFGKQPSSILDKRVIKGLIGELIVIRDYLLSLYPEDTVLSGWTGPLMSHKDFEMDETWFEVKTVNSGSNQISISSIEQLDSNRDGKLIIVLLDDTNEANALRISLNGAVLGVLDKLKSEQSINLLCERLSSIGYQYSSQYEDIVFEYKGMDRYNVSSDFPRLKRIELPESLVEAKYSLSISGLISFKESSNDSR